MPTGYTLTLVTRSQGIAILVYKTGDANVPNQIDPIVVDEIDGNVLDDAPVKAPVRQTSTRAIKKKKRGIVDDDSDE